MVASSPFADSADCCAKASFESSSSIAGFSSLSNSSQQSHHFLGTNDNASKFSCSSSSTDATSRNSLEKSLPIHHSRDSMKILSKPHKVHDQAWDSIKRLICKEGTLSIGQFKLLHRVGQGDIGSVFLSQLKGSNCQFAMKVMDKDALTRRKKLQRIYREREILEVLDHPFLPTLYAHFEAEQFSCLVMDFCPGGDLHAVRQKHPGKRFGVKAARFYAAEVLLALEYLHMLGIVYRDLKPENVLVRGDGHIMLTDFDLSFKCDVQPKLLKCPMSASISSSSGRFGLLRSFSVSSSMSASSHWQDISMDCVLPSACTIHPFLSCLPLAAKFSTKAQETQKQNQKHPLSLFYFKQLGRIKSSKVDVVTSGLAAQAPCQVGRTEDAGRKDEKTCNFNTHEDSKQAAINLSVNGSAPSLVINGSTVPRAEDACIYEEMLGMELVAEPTQARSMSFVGTHEYLAPEVIAGQGHGNAVDWWTFGIFLFELLYGRTPFKGSCNEQTLLNIVKQPLRFPEWGHVNVGEHTKSLIEGLLVKDPQKRLGSIKGAAEIKQHSFFRGVNWALIRSTQPPEVPNNNKTKATLHHHHHHNHVHNQQHRHQDDEQGKLLIASRSASKPLPHFDYF